MGYIMKTIYAKTYKRYQFLSTYAPIKDGNNNEQENESNIATLKDIKRVSQKDETMD